MENKLRFIFGLANVVVDIVVDPWKTREDHNLIDARFVCGVQLDLRVLAMYFCAGHPTTIVDSLTNRMCTHFFEFVTSNGNKNKLY